LSLLSKDRLFQKVLSGIQASGLDAKVISRDHPFQLLLSYDGITETVRVYIWNVTHGGGRVRAADEYRIQITGVNRIRTGTNFRTLLLGWDERHQVFVGYNAGRYETFGSSPSLQVKDGTLSSAARQGLAVQPKEFDSQGDVTEVVVAFKPELFGAYSSNIDKYHQQKMTELEATLLERVATQIPPTDNELASLAEERRHVIREVERAVRLGKFRKLVLQAYDGRCAVCGLGLGLVHAAHIVPLERGTDEPSNGIALCPNHHAAFDRDILLIKEDYSVNLNPRLSRTGNRTDLERLLEQTHGIALPNDPRLQPNPEYLRRRAEMRGIWFT
jgi:putative restriction endonuclease